MGLILAAIYGICVIVIGIGLWRAPVGYQDQNGYHDGEVKHD